jgi:MFS family permease
MIFPLLPLFLADVLLADKSIIGLIEGVSTSIASILKVFSGWISDKVGKRKKFVVAGYGLSTFVKPFLYIANSWPAVLGVRFFDRVGKGIRTAPRDAIIADSTNKKTRGKVFGFHRSMDTLGATLGPLIALFLFPLLGYRNLFLVAVLPAIGAVILLWFLSEKTTSKVKPKKIKLSLKPFNRTFKLFMVVSAVFAVSNFSYAFLVLRASDFFTSTESILLLYLLFNIIYALLSTPIGLLSDKVGRKKVIFTGYVLFSFLTFGLAFASSGLIMVLIFAGYGIFKALTDSTQRAYTADLAGKKYRATGLGVYHTIDGIAELPASILLGILWQFFGPIAFLYSTVLSGAAAILLLSI